MGLIAGTTFVKMDEPCFSLKEENLQSPGSRGWRRYQIVKVVRDDKITEFRRDLGPARKYKASQILIPGGIRDIATGRGLILHTVAEMLDIADGWRNGEIYKKEVAWTQPWTPPQLKKKN
jgi:hypothetical protein